MGKSDNKITILQEIRDAKIVLFGAFSDKLTKEDKVEKWKQILFKCQSLGLVSADKEYTYVRDTFWSNIKRATLNPCSSNFLDLKVASPQSLVSVTREPITLGKNLKFVTKGSKAHTEIEEEKSRKKRKLELQLEYLELQNYKMKLEVMELEKRLNVSTSKYTKGIKVHDSQEFENAEGILNVDNIVFINDIVNEAGSIVTNYNK